MICCCQHCSLISVLFEPPTSKKNYHCSIDQKTSICMQKSSTSPGKSYMNVFLSHWYMMLYLWAVMVVCNLLHLSFVAWWIQDASFFWQGLLLPIFSSVLIIWQRNRWWRFQFRVDWCWGTVCFVLKVCSKIKPSNDGHIIGSHLFKVCSETKFYDKGHIIGPHLVKVHSKTKSSNKGHIIGPHLVKVRSKTKSSNKGHIIRPHLVEVSCLIKSSDEGHHYFPTLGQNPLRDKSSNEGHQYFATFGWSLPHNKSSNSVSCLISNTHHSLFTLWIPLAWALHKSHVAEWLNGA